MDRELLIVMADQAWDEVTAAEILLRRAQDRAERLAEMVADYDGRIGSNAGVAETQTG